MPPTTTPVPTPTQIVQLAPDVVDKLVPDPGWPTQPWATIIAGTLAIVGAGIAFWSAKLSIRAADDRAVEDRKTAAEALSAQLRAQAETQAAQFERDYAKERRDRCVDAGVNGLAAATTLINTCINTFYGFKDENDEKLDAASLACDRAISAFELLQMDAAGDALSDLRITYYSWCIEERSRRRGGGGEISDPDPEGNLWKALQSQVRTDIQALHPNRPEKPR